MACDGQVLVTYDMLGMFEDFTPKFVNSIPSRSRYSCFQRLKGCKEKSFPSKVFKAF